MKTEKIQKLLAEAGLGSRRALEQWITAGRVRCNGHLVKLGDRATWQDQLAVDGRLISPPTTPCRVLLYYKPEGEVCTRKDEQQRRTIFQALPTLVSGRWITVGRLDLNSMGLLLLTTDGDLANHLMHPKTQFIREYQVRIDSPLSEFQKQALLTGVLLEDGSARVEKIEKCIDIEEVRGHVRYQVRVREGRNRLIRRLFQSQGKIISQLVRFKYGPIELPTHLKPGQWKELTMPEIQYLKQSRLN